MASNRQLIPEAKQGLAKFKNEVANEMGVPFSDYNGDLTSKPNEMGVPFSDYNGDLTSKQCGSVGGEMVKRMVEQYESKIK
ncbi:MAG: alpha/beta-type small acid-soluble spore protein [Clostridium sp.]|uniref:alpha/beta-type small acid-soluble spore protein n=1 Tax=Clostridium sp. TaxID=1506 RepID=UPI00290CB104|nr:alpha/beta-type small acid-soluble spore protein [Clostridium sp.]MDU7949847.1 alpha/beta-type small acid-soluble spore protein [Clostridium sp.]